MGNPTNSQILFGFAIICAVSASLCLLIWLVSRSLKRHGLIVSRQEPPREWAEFAQARDELGRVIAKELRLHQIVGSLSAKLSRRRA